MPYLVCPVCVMNPIARSCCGILKCQCGSICPGPICESCSIELKKCYSCGKNIKSGNEYIEDLIKLHKRYEKIFGKPDNLYEEYKNKSIDEMINLSIKN